MSGKISNPSFHDAMLARYPSESHVTMFEVANGTGSGASRWADALTFSLWPSHGHDIDGFEFKSARADWLKELKQPEKSYPVWQHCNRWWLVTSDPKIADKSELPKGWGLMVLGSKGLRVAKMAERRDTAAPPLAFIASMLRAAAKPVVRGKQEEFSTVYAKAEAICDERWKGTVERLHKEKQKLQEELRDFKEQSGIDPQSWEFRHADPEAIGEAVKSLMRGEHSPGLERVKRACESVLQYVATFEKAEAGFKKPLTDSGEP